MTESHVTRIAAENRNVLNFPAGVVFRGRSTFASRCNLWNDSRRFAYTDHDARGVASSIRAYRRRRDLATSSDLTRSTPACLALSDFFPRTNEACIYLTSLLFHQAGATFFLTFVDSLRMDTFEGNNKYEGRYMEYLRNLLFTLLRRYE